MSERVTRKEQEEFIAGLETTPETRRIVAELPQDCLGWHASRRGRMTGSIIGAAVGHNPFCSHLQLLSQLLWDSFQGNEATRWGKAMEKTALEIYEKFRENDNIVVHCPGLVLHASLPWFGYSPDGLIIEQDGQRILLEIKCPFTKKLYPRIKMYYYDQIQFGMWMMNCAFCDFVVYTPNLTSIERFAYDEDYVQNFLVPRAQAFYFQKYLPLLLLKTRGALAQNRCDLINVVVERLDPRTKKDDKEENFIISNNPRQGPEVVIVGVEERAVVIGNSSGE